MEEKFSEFYENYKNKLDEIYIKFNQEKNKIERRFFLAMIVFLILFVFATYKLKLLFDSYAVFIIIGCIAIVASVIVGIFLRLRREMYKINRNIIEDIIKYISLDEEAIYEPDKRISIDNIKEMELFNLDNLKYNGKNVIGTNYNNNYMNFADMEIYYYKDKIKEDTYYDSKGNPYTKKSIEKIKKTLFSGCYISATLNKKIAEHIYLIPNNFSDLIINGAIKDYITYSGEEIELENLEFSKKYKVYSDDEIQARYILSLALMEKINEIDDIFDGKKYIVFKEGRRFVICIEGFKIEDLRKTLLPFNRNSPKVQENLKYIFKNLYKLFEIYNVLDLGSDLYVDNK